MGRLRFWMESLTDVELGRVADATAWDKNISEQDGDYNPRALGCAICHATGNRFGKAYSLVTLAAIETFPIYRAEMRYMSYARRHNDFKAGQLMQSFARAILARRKLAAYPVHPKALPSVAQSSGAQA